MVDQYRSWIDFIMFFFNTIIRSPILRAWLKYIEDICFFRWKIEIYFIEWTPSVIFSQVALPLMKILPMVFTENNKYSVYFMLLTLSGRSFIKIKYSSFLLFPMAYPFHVVESYYITVYENHGAKGKKNIDFLPLFPIASMLTKLPSFKKREILWRR